MKHTMTGNVWNRQARWWISAVLNDRAAIAFISLTMQPSICCMASNFYSTEGEVMKRVVPVSGEIIV